MHFRWFQIFQLEPTITEKVSRGQGFTKLSSKSSMMRFIDGNHEETTLNEKVSPDWCKPDGGMRRPGFEHCYICCSYIGNYF